MSIQQLVRYPLLLAALALVATRSLALAESRIFTLPFDDPRVLITAGWIYDLTPLADPCPPEGLLCHRGIDYARPKDGSGDSSFTVVAAASGRAVLTYSESYGNVVYIAHDTTDGQGKRLFTLYAHLADGSSVLPFKTREEMTLDISRDTFDEWNPVDAGNPVGFSGASGYRVNGVHLHFEIQRGGYPLNKTDPYGIYNNKSYYPQPCEPSAPELIPPFDIGIGPLWATCPPGGTSLLTLRLETQLENWLGQGDLTFTKIYRKATGDDSLDFHAAADGQGATFTLMEATYGATTYIIGGYNPQSWSSIGDYNITITDAERTAFIYNLTTGMRQTQRLTTDPFFAMFSDAGQWQTYNDGNFGPAFGVNGYDLSLNDQSLSSGYVLQYSYGDGSPCGFLGLNIFGVAAWPGPCFPVPVSSPDYSPYFSVGALEVYTFTPAAVPE